MTINKKEHKILIYHLFFTDGREKHFPLNQLQQASSLTKKLIDNANPVKDDKGVLQGYKWEDSQIELTLDEAVFAKELLLVQTEAAPSDYETIEELKKLFDK